MAVKNWHFGKIVLLWVCGMLPALMIVLVFGDTSRSGDFRIDEEPLATAFAAVLVALGFLVPLTWKWLSGKEKRD